MKVTLKPGKYVLAVSGGVDSVVLLDLLSHQHDLELVVAHFDHGIRPDSAQDKDLVATLSQKYNWPFEYGEGKLGAQVSEEQARRARYEFLRQVREKHQAVAIVTAHHQDDAVETLVFNVLRGTKRKGVSALQSTEGIQRPLLEYNKSQIRDYAQKHNLVWREDSTNSDERYVRNWIRRRLLPRLSKQQKHELATTYTQAVTSNAEVDDVVSAALVKMQTGEGVDRKKFIALPYLVACEVMAVWLKQRGISEVDRRLIHVLVVSAKTLPPGKSISISKKWHLSITADLLLLVKT